MRLLLICIHCQRNKANVAIDVSIGEFFLRFVNGERIVGRQIGNEIHAVGKEFDIVAFLGQANVICIDLGKMIGCDDRIHTQILDI